MNCPHSNLTLILTPEGPHHGKNVCSDCGRFVNWAPKPATVERQQSNAREVVRLRGDDRLKSHEREFISTLDGQGPKISPKQQAWLDSLSKKYYA